MKNEYIDITSQEYHNKQKKIYLTFQIIRFCMNLFLMIGFVSLIVIFAPYASGEKEFEKLPFTLSQLEGLLGVLVFAYFMKKTHF